MNNLSIKQILRQKNIPEEIGIEIIQYLPFPGQEKKKKELGVRVIMLNKLNQFPESFKNSIGLVSLTIIIFFVFFVLNIFLLYINSLLQC